MYRQILVRPPDRNYLQIFWQFSNNSPIDEYRLYTVTYGTSTVPFQVMRTIQEWENTDSKLYSLAAMTHLLTIYYLLQQENAVKFQNEIITLCAVAQMEHRKCNNP